MEKCNCILRSICINFYNIEKFQKVHNFEAYSLQPNGLKTQKSYQRDGAYQSTQEFARRLLNQLKGKSKDYSSISIRIKIFIDLDEQTRYVSFFLIFDRFLLMFVRFLYPFVG